MKGKDIKTTVRDRIKNEQNLILEQLKKTPIVQIACEKTGVSRATYYRWRKEDKEFAKQADESLQEGNLLVNDMAESQLLSAVRDKNMTGIIFWLKHHHPTYATRVEVTTNQKPQEALTPEQQKAVKEALTLTGLAQDDQGNNS